MIIEQTNTPQGQFTPKLDKMSGMDAQRAHLRDILREYYMEAWTCSKEWKDKARLSWDMIHGRVDWSYKTPEQSKVHMNRVGLAQEQIKAQVKQGLINFDEWLIVEDEKGFESSILSSSEAKRMVKRGLSGTSPRSQITENIGIACVENVLATKLQPVIKEKTAPGGKKIKEFSIEHVILDIRTFLSDVWLDGLYQIHESTMDKYKLLELSAEKPTRDKPYRLDAVKKLSSGIRVEEVNEQRDKGNDIYPNRMSRRQRVMVQEFWGTVLDDKGDIMKWKNEDGSELELKNVVITMANQMEIIRDPEPYPTWDGESLFVVTTLLKAHENAYGRSLLAPGVDMNRAEDELINAAIDAGLKEAYNVNVLKVHGLADKSQASGGIKYGATLLQNAQLLPGEKLLDTVSTGVVPQGLLQVLGIIKSAGAENLRLNEIALSGNLPGKQVRSTEIVQAQSTIQGLFESICSDLEDDYVSKYAKKAFLLVLQYADLLSDHDLEYIFYGRKDRIEAFQALSAKKRYDELANSFRFRGKGLRGIAHNARQAQMLQNIFSMVAANPIILDVFERRGFDPVALFEDILKGMQLDIEKYLSPDAAVFANVRQLIREDALANQAAIDQQAGNAPQGGGRANMPNAPMTAPPGAMAPGSGQMGI